MIRPTYRAGLFYPGDASSCRQQLEDCLREAQQDQPPPADPVAAIVPHAGWVYSGRVAAGALKALAARTPRPEVVVLFGAVHVPGVEGATLTPAEAWDTPLGPVEVAVEVRERLSALLPSDAAAHRGEHSLEVQLPFLRHLLPEARVLPIAVPPCPGAAGVGARIAEELADLEDRVVFVGSTDLSHYGPRFGLAHHGVGAPALRWVREENDARMIRHVEALAAEAVVDEANDHHNACGAGAIAATLAAARVRGRERAVVTGYTTSADVSGEAEPENFVGYLGAVA